MYYFLCYMLLYQTTKSEYIATKILVEAQKLNPVWQKFCQYIACRDDLIGNHLANKLQTLLDNCTLHDHNYSINILNKEFKGIFNLKDIKDENIIGSGTIAQVYKVHRIYDDKIVAIKIKHPEVIKMIDETKTQFESIIKLSWIPNNIRDCMIYFFDGICKQSNFYSEYEAGIKFYNIFYNLQHPSNKRSVFIIPKMEDVSENALVMDYEPGEYNLHSLESDIQQQIIPMIIFIQVVCLNYGLLHSDLHWGNFSIRTEPELKIILYDFGWLLDFTDKPAEFCKEWAQILYRHDVDRMFKMIVDKDVYQEHIIPFSKILRDINNDYFSTRVKSLLLYCQTHNLNYDSNMISILYACIHCERLETLNNTNFEDIYKQISNYAEYDLLDLL